MQDERNAEEFVEIGTIAETHGLYGELRVRSLTDFPEERFETVRFFWGYNTVDNLTACICKQFVLGLGL